MRWASGVSGGPAPEETKPVVSSGVWKPEHGILWRSHQRTRYHVRPSLSPGDAKWLCDIAEKVSVCNWTSICAHAFNISPCLRDKSTIPSAIRQFHEISKLSSLKEGNSTLAFSSASHLFNLQLCFFGLKSQPPNLNPSIWVFSVDWHFHSWFISIFPCSL